MATKTDNASTFKIVAGLIAVLLIAAAGLVYLQSESGGSSSGPELAALSQAIPSQAARALNGEDGAFDQLDASIKKVASLRRGGAPGRSADWQQLESQASAILAKRSDVDAVHTAAKQLLTDATAVLGGSNELLDRSGATAIIQEFQQRADQIRQAAATLPNGGDSAANAIVKNVAFLRDVVNGLNGDDSDLDIRPLTDDGRAMALAPVLPVIASLEDQSASLSASIGRIAGLGATRTQLEASANALLSSAFGSSGGNSLLPAILNVPWIPIGMLGLAILLLLGLQLLHGKSAVFERAAKEQAEQNERNQQAILRLLDEMGSLADGDLTVEATVTEDITGTIADSFNFAIEELRKLVATVNDTALMVDMATKQTENTAAHLAKAADNQAKEINAATESIVSMAASIEEVSGNAERSSDVARHSVEVAHKGGEAVRRTIDGMNAIRETIQETSKRIKRLGESSQEIGNIIELINDIAEQTNILALNAAIQAAMAGEAGRGFAVVADEVQRLAERSSDATRQIEALVKAIQTDTNEAVASMEQSTAEVVGGAQLAHDAGQALEAIETVSTHLAELITTISGSAKQQANAATNISDTMNVIQEITTQTSAGTNETSASIGNLAGLADDMGGSVAGFKLPE